MTWPSRTLGDVAVIERNSIQPAQISTGTTYVGLENIKSDGTFSGVGGVDAGELGRAKFRFGPSHLLYGKLRPYLSKIARPNFSGICSTDIVPIRVGPELERDYLFHLLRLPVMVERATSLSVGVNLPRLSPSTLALFEIPVPPIEEQRRIATILDKAEALCRLREGGLLLVDRSIESAFHAASEDAPIRDLGQVVEFMTSGARGWAGFYSETGARFIRSLDVRMLIVSDDSAVFVSPPQSAEARRILTTEGDVLLTITGSRIGRVAVTPKPLAGSYISQHVAILRVDDTVVAPDWLAMWLASPAGQSQIASGQYGQTKPGLSFEKIRAFHLTIPTRAKQDDFLQLASAAKRIRDGHRTQADQFKALFAALQHRAFRGEL